MKDGTRVVRAGLPPLKQGEPILPGPTFAGVYAFKGEVGTSAYTYGRYHNPTWTNFERALGELEGGHAVAFSSGLAAVTALLSVALEPTKGKNVVVMPSDGYYGARALAEGFFAARGIEVRKARTKGDAQGALLEGATMLWLETPTNPDLDVCDVRKLVKAARASGALVAVDNSTSTPLGQRPLELGADFTVASDSKALTGHADVILGHVAAKDRVWAEKLQSFRSQQGAVPGPMEVWLAHRSLATLELRLDRQCKTALAVARELKGRREVKLVRYPGLQDDPSYTVARRQMKRFGQIVSFVLAGKREADRFLEACKLVIAATSFGGVHTTAERRSRWGGDSVPPGFIRFSAGCEDTGDIVEDVTQALDGLKK